ncbi:MAG: T9SS type A sorting domain-containing protein [Bacteroidetes bacterium]|nr:T9SS type A sorting domain-containing protein [Bacteroidota bacterium]
MKTIKTMLLVLFALGVFSGNAQINCGILQPYFYSANNPNGVPVFHDTTTYAQGWQPVSYFWDFGDGSSSNLASPSHVFQPGVFNVCMTVTAQLQGSSITCVDTFCKTYSNCNGIVVATFTYSNLGNGQIQFSGNGSSNYPPLTYSWDFGDGSTSTSQNPAHTFTNGSYQVCLTVTSSNGCSASYCSNVSVTNNLCGSLSAGLSASNPTATAVILNSTTTGTNANTLYQWYADGVALNNPGPNSSYTLTGVSTGYHTYCLYVYANANTFCDSSCITYYVQNGTNSCATANASFNATSGNGTVTATSNSSGVPNGAQYQWFISGPYNASTPLSAGMMTVQWNNLPSGTYNVCLYIWSSNQAWCDSTCQTISVQNSNPCAGINSQFTYTNQGNLYTFTGTNANSNNQLIWKVNGVSVGQGNTFSYTFPTSPASVTYTVCHVVSIPGTVCIDSTCSAVVVSGNGGNPCLNFSASVNTNVDPNGIATMYAVPNGGSQPFTFAWSNGVTTQSFNPTSTGIYCVTVYDNNQCSAAACDSFFAGNPCNLNVVVYTQSTSAPYVLIANATGGTAPYTYVWSNGSSTSNILTVTAPGVYCMSVVDANGCVADACYTVQGTTLPTDTICGVVFNDLNGNGVQDAGEPGIAGAYIYVGNYPAYTDSFGHYVTVVPAGTYNVMYCPQGGNSVTVPVYSSAGTLNNCPSYPVSIAGTGGSHCGYNFGIQNNNVSICGTIFFDANNNNVQDNGETGIGSVHVYITRSNGTVYHAYTSQSGQYCVTVPAGNYTITMSNGNFQACVSTPQNISVAATTAGQSYNNNNFATYCQPGICNLYISVTPHTTVTAGFPAWYDVQVCNIGTSVSSGTVNFFYDNTLVFDNASPVQTSLNASTRTVSWALNNLLPGDCEYYWINFDALTNIQLNQFVFTLVNVTPASGCNDVNTTNNVDTVHQAVTGSWDPNNKLAFTTNTETNPAQHWISTIEPNQRIEYVVNFQNTGTAPAVNVVIVDEIAADLDPTSFEFLGSSHGCFVTRTGNMLNFQFPQIMLPDSTNDEPNSHGFVKFAVNALANLPEGTVIADDAAIYFDYNDAVITNESEVLLIGLSAIDDMASSATVVVAPNPMNQFAEIRISSLQEGFKFVVTDLTGRVVSENFSDSNNLMFDRNNLSAGIYTYQVVQNGKASAKGKLVIQ